MTSENDNEDLPLDRVQAEIIDRLNRLWSNPEQPAASEDSQFGFMPELANYRIESVLGRGAFGVVYAATDLRRERKVAIKIPRVEVLVDDDKKKRFKSEAKAAASLNHDSIVPVFEASFGLTPFIVMAYCEGPDLGRWILETPVPATWPEAAAFMATVAEAVDYAHSRGVYHRDLKPSNILLERLADSTSIKLSSYKPLLADFGLAKLADHSLTDTRSSLILGTPSYMAPEQLESAAPLTAATDVYALGSILFELISGKMPVEGSTYVEVVDRLRDSPPIRLRSIAKDIPRDLDRVVTRCLEKNPRARYQTAGELARDLRACVAGNAISAKPTGMFERFRYWSQHPIRIRDAGRFMVFFHLVVALWVILIAFTLPQYDLLSSAQFSQALRDMAIVVFGVHLPGICIGYYTIRRREWSYWCGLIFSAGNVIGILAQILRLTPILFANAYLFSDFYRVQIEAFILIGIVIQLVLYCFAWRAHRRMHKTRPIRDI